MHDNSTLNECARRIVEALKASRVVPVERRAGVELPPAREPSPDAASIHAAEARSSGLAGPRTPPR